MTAVLTDWIAPVTDADRAAFAADGVIVLRQLLTPAGLDGLRAMIAAELDESWQQHSPGRPQPGRRRFHNNGFLWRRHEEVLQMCRDSVLPALAADLLDTERMRLLMDEVFVKEPQTDVAVPWHNDASYWPVAGRAMGSFWFALDDVDADNGAVHFRPGSYLRSALHRPTSFLADGPDPLGQAGGTGERSWSLQAGDALFFSAFTEHSSPGNDSLARRRRAYSVRYAASDVRYDPRGHLADDAGARSRAWFRTARRHVPAGHTSALTAPSVRASGRVADDG